MGRDSTAWGSLFNLDSSARLPGLGETQTALPLPTSLPSRPQQTRLGGMGEAQGRAGEKEDVGPAAALTSFSPPHPWPTSSQGGTYNLPGSCSHLPTQEPPHPRRGKRPGLGSKAHLEQSRPPSDALTHRKKPRSAPYPVWGLPGFHSAAAAYPQHPGRSGPRGRVYIHRGG